MSNDENDLPAPSKGAMGGLSGVSTDGVMVHRVSGKPAQAQAQGNEIHLAPGQEQVRSAREVDDRADGRREMTTVQAAPRFVAFSTIDDEPWEVSPNAGGLLDRVRELASLGIGLVRFTEILDCGTEASDVMSEGMSLAEARTRFPTVFRGDGVAGLPPVALEGTEP